MPGATESSEMLIWLAWLVRSFAVIVPLLIALYGFLKTPKDNRLVAIGLLMATMVALALFLGARQAAKRDREIRELREETEAAKVELEQRGFQPDVRKRIVTQLRGIHGPSVFVLANSPDEDTSQFAREIGAVFKEAGWAVPASFGIMSNPVVLPGENQVATGVILGATPEVPRNISEAIIAVLTENGVEIRIGPHWPGTEHPISILVGPKLKK